MGPSSTSSAMIRVLRTACGMSFCVERLSGGMDIQLYSDVFYADVHGHSAI
jgi:hypothetical protein